MTRDVHRALELLEEYHANLIRGSDADLRFCIERVVNSFKTGLFNALCDIQDFYENVLLNQGISFAQKAVEARRFADRWDGTHSFFARPGPVLSQPILPAPRPTSALSGVRFGPIETIGSGGVLNYSNTSRVGESYGSAFDLIEVTVDASKAGLGFSISGGIDRPTSQHGHHIHITEIKPGGAVHTDGRLRIGDVILKVNEQDISQVPHERAVAALNSPTPFFRILVKRDRLGRSLSQSQLTESRLQQPIDLKPVHRSRSLHQIPSNTMARPQSRQSYGVPFGSIPTRDQEAPRRVVLRKGTQGLGLNIVGGETGEPIYISQITPNGVADLSGQVRRGDVLLKVNDIDLLGASHHDAATALTSIPPHSLVNLILHYRPYESSVFFDKLQRASNPNLSYGMQ